ncbi:nucleotidyltransferase domain-containing protein [Synechocystis salina LEGE 06155]|nr:nucleotidyltransferase domain-containing protein [Synechocystis salina LEGE 06155]
MSNSILLKEDQQAQLQNRLGISLDEIAKVCRSHSIQSLAVFGSILTDNFKPSSDIDFLVSVPPDLRLTLDYQQSLEQALEQVFNRKIDLVFLRNLERSENWIKKKSIINSAEVIYES